MTVIISQSTAASLIAEWSQTDINYVKDVLAKIESALWSQADINYIKDVLAKIESALRSKAAFRL